MKHKHSILTSALLVIDVQDSFKARPRWNNRNNPAFEKNVSDLVQLYRNAGLPIYYFLDSDDDEEFKPSSPYFKLMEFVEAKEGEPVLVKYTRNCFTGTNLDYLLRRSGVSRVTICGIKTEQCCETTARVASDLGYDVDYVTEATLTFPIEHPNGGKTLTPPEVVERTEYALRDRFARIVSVADLAGEIQQTKSA